ncbi:clamp loader small subunit [Synechococcus phage S-CREM1]|nr:clamp loader small subunit [Synechococcus phage S-CREM1]
MTELKDWLNSINQSKINIMDENPDSISKYPAYVINRCLSGHMDAVLYANEMNINCHLDNKMQYDFYINSLRSKKRFSPWLKKDSLKDLELVKQYYGYSNEKAKTALGLLTKEQLNYIESKLNTGGKK